MLLQTSYLKHSLKNFDCNGVDIDVSEKEELKLK